MEENYYQKEKKNQKKSGDDVEDRGWRHQRGDEGRRRMTSRERWRSSFILPDAASGVFKGSKFGTEKGKNHSGTEGRNHTEDAAVALFLPSGPGIRQNINVSLTVEECL